MRFSLLVSAFLFALAATSPQTAPDRLQAPFSSLQPAAVLHLGKTADWVLPTTEGVWVGSTGPFAVHLIDPTTNRVIASVALPGEPCAGLAAGFGSLWAPLCGRVNTLARIDLKTLRLKEVLPFGPAAAESGIAAGGGGVWMITDANGALANLDPKTGRIRQTVRVPAGSYNPLYSDGIVWVTGHDSGVVTAVEALNGKLLATVPVGEGPRFLTAGAGAIWVLLQGTGEVVRIDAVTRQVVARIAAGLVGHGGDISFGGRQVWTTLSGTPLTKIDAQTNQIQQQWTGPGGDSLAWAFGSLWLTNYKEGTVARYPAAALGVQ